MRFSTLGKCGVFRTYQYQSLASYDPISARSNNPADGFDEQQPKCEFRLLILYRPTNTGSASLRTAVVLVHAMVHQGQDVAEAY